MIHQTFMFSFNKHRFDENVQRRLRRRNRQCFGKGDAWNDFDMSNWSEFINDILLCSFNSHLFLCIDCSLFNLIMSWELTSIDWLYCLCDLITSCSSIRLVWFELSYTLPILSVLVGTSQYSFDTTRSPIKTPYLD